MTKMLSDLNLFAAGVSLGIAIVSAFSSIWDTAMIQFGLSLLNFSSWGLLKKVDK